MTTRLNRISPFTKGDICSFLYKVFFSIICFPPQFFLFVFFFPRKPMWEQEAAMEFESKRGKRKQKILVRAATTDDVEHKPPPQWKQIPNTSGAARLLF